MASTAKLNLMEATPKHVITVVHDDTRTNFYGTGAFLPTGELLVPDGDGDRLLLFADDFFYLQEFQIREKPRDLTLGPDENIYVLTNKTVLKCQIDGDDLNTLDTFAPPKSSQYVTSHPDGLMFSSSEGFVVTNTEGKVLNTFKFKNSNHSNMAVVSTKLKRFYHMGEHCNNVIGRKLSDGNEVFNFSTGNPSTYSVQLDADGNVYICLPNPCLIIQVSKDRRKNRELLNKFDKISPQRILFHLEKNLLVVYGKGRVFEVYKLE